MDAAALERVADWGRVAGWSLLPQALVAVSLTVLAAQGRMRIAAAGYGLALAGLLVAAGMGLSDGAALMAAMDAAFVLVAVACLWALGPRRWAWLPGRAMLAALLPLLMLTLLPRLNAAAGLGWGLGLAAAAAMAVMLCTLVASAEVRQALQR
jgi:hypothetical protein